MCACCGALASRSFRLHGGADVVQVGAADGLRSPLPPLLACRASVPPPRASPDLHSPPPASSPYRLCQAYGPLNRGISTEGGTGVAMYMIQALAKRDAGHSPPRGILVGRNLAVGAPALPTVARRAISWSGRSPWTDRAYSPAAGRPQHCSTSTRGNRGQVLPRRTRRLVGAGPAPLLQSGTCRAISMPTGISVALRASAREAHEAVAADRDGEVGVRRLHGQVADGACQTRACAR